MSTKLIPLVPTPLRLRAANLLVLLRSRFTATVGSSGGGCSARAPCRSGTRMARGRPEASDVDWPLLLSTHKVVHVNRAVNNDEGSMSTRDEVVGFFGGGGGYVWFLLLSVQFDIQSAAAQEMRSGGDDAKMTDKTMMNDKNVEGQGHFLSFLSDELTVK